jgi:hypothetical protein
VRTRLSRASPQRCRCVQHVISSAGSSFLAFHRHSHAAIPSPSTAGRRDQLCTSVLHRGPSQPAAAAVVRLFKVNKPQHPTADCPRSAWRSGNSSDWLLRCCDDDRQHGVVRRQGELRLCRLQPKQCAPSAPWQEATPHPPSSQPEAPQVQQTMLPASVARAVTPKCSSWAAAPEILSGPDPACELTAGRRTAKLLHQWEQESAGGAAQVGADSLAAAVPGAPEGAASVGEGAPTPRAERAPEPARAQSEWCATADAGPEARSSSVVASGAAGTAWRAGAAARAGLSKQASEEPRKELAPGGYQAAWPRVRRPRPGRGPVGFRIISDRRRVKQCTRRAVRAGDQRQEGGAEQDEKPAADGQALGHEQAQQGLAPPLQEPRDLPSVAAAGPEAPPHEVATGETEPASQADAQTETLQVHAAAAAIQTASPEPKGEVSPDHGFNASVGSSAARAIAAAAAMAAVASAQGCGPPAQPATAAAAPSQSLDRGEAGGDAVIGDDSGTTAELSQLILSALARSGGVIQPPADGGGPSLAEEPDPAASGVTRRWSPVVALAAKDAGCLAFTSGQPAAPRFFAVSDIRLPQEWPEQVQQQRGVTAVKEAPARSRSRGHILGLGGPVRSGCCFTACPHHMQLLCSGGSNGRAREPTADCCNAPGSCSAAATSRTGDREWLTTEELLLGQDGSAKSRHGTQAATPASVCGRRARSSSAVEQRSSRHPQTVGGGVGNERQASTEPVVASPATGLAVACCALEGAVAGGNGGAPARRHRPDQQAAASALASDAVAAAEPACKAAAACLPAGELLRLQVRNTAGHGIVRGRCLLRVRCYMLCVRAGVGACV